MSPVADSKIAAIADMLSRGQRIIMGQLERTRKTNSRYFAESDLGRKKPVWSEDIDVKATLMELQSLGLVSQVNPSKGLWEATSTGFLVEHYVSKQDLLKRNPGINKIVRR